MNKTLDLTGVFQPLERNFFTARTTIQARSSGAADAYGVVLEAWAQVGSLNALPSAISAVSGDDAQVRSSDGTFVILTHKLVFAGVYEGIEEGHRALVTPPGQSQLALDVVAVRRNAQGFATSLGLRRVDHDNS